MLSYTVLSSKRTLTWIVSAYVLNIVISFVILFPILFYIPKNYNDKIAKPFYDTISTVGQKVDKDSSLKIGDTIENIAFNMDKVFGPGKEKIYETLTLISSSKEGNTMILMDKNKSFYEIPRDELLASYTKQQEKIHKAEIQQQRRNSVEIER